MLQKNSKLLKEVKEVYGALPEIKIDKDTPPEEKMLKIGETILGMHTKIEELVVNTKTGDTSRGQSWA